ncbi:putative C6 transcription factor [Bimuria novae-zelandiae CBS 107.79]|uniref:Putative C6 transcription factor n=1 Tax=Bimuria novae-zelandiae CBS 107.79 TaxID=1447943 RepID=A0A6A5ULN8_9PLEO|nr:putative C6 transcription factor [Bimuria novae-zelandiae CBS 107.79]
MSEANATRTRQVRQRSRIACEPCRERKRKCDGGDPCSLCRVYGYECSYRSHPRKRRRDGGSALPSQTHPTSPPDDTVTLLDQTPPPTLASTPFVQSLESNSGSAFVRTFAFTVDPNNAPPSQMLGWNVFLGQRQMSTSMPLRNITDIVTQTTMEDLVAVYFGKLDPCYGFVDRKYVDDAVQQQWLSGSGSSASEAVLCGIAALGCVFSNLQDLQTETSLFVLAKLLLDLASDDISIDTAIAWILRTVYLRLTGKPDETWMASCVALHLIDAAGLHCESGTDAPFRRAGRSSTPDQRRRMLGVTRHLNVWLSFDLGRTRVTLQNMSTVPAAPRPDDYTTELLGLLSYTENMDPTKSIRGPELVTAMSEVLNRVHTRPPSILAQCNLTLCLFRRLYTLRWPVESANLDKVVQLIERAIQAVHTLLEAGSPWHHMANVPFQSVCTLLAIDTTKSFSLLGPTMACLASVSDTYRTRATQDAHAAARALILMHQKRREANVLRQSEMLKLYPTEEPTGQDTSGQFSSDQAQTFADLPWFSEFFTDMEIANFLSGTG